MKRIQSKLQEDKKLLSIYFTAGYPNTNDTVTVLKELEKNGVDMVEIGLPFSDPLADGPTIQESSTRALKKGMTTEKLFEQLKDIRSEVTIPLLIMGYFNPIYQYGIEEFCQKCEDVGIDGLIIPDLPLKEYVENYKEIFEKHNLTNIFLVTPQTSEKRILEIDANSNTFIYLVSSANVTGSNSDFQTETQDYFKRIESMNLNNPQVVGFGIHDKDSFQKATEFQKGAIIGSSYIKFLENNLIEETNVFINKLV
jgi:tryptophan synthase alpha chain